MCGRLHRPLVRICGSGWRVKLDTGRTFLRPRYPRCSLDRLEIRQDGGEVAFAVIWMYLGRLGYTISLILPLLAYLPRTRLWARKSE